VNLQAYLDVLRRRWRSTAVVVVLCVLGSGLLSLTATPTYQASASLFFSLQNGNTANELAQGSTFTQNQMASYATLATTAAVLEPVIDDLDLDASVRRLARQVSATTPNDTVVLRIAVTSTSAAEAAEIANSVAEHLTEAVDDLAPVDDDGAPSVRSTLVAPAEAPLFPASPNTRLNLVVGLFLGLVLGVLQALLREALDNRVRDVAIVTELSDLPVVGSIPTWSSRSATAVALEEDPHSASAEALRHLRTNLQFLDVAGESGSGGARLVAVTSSQAGEGKSTISLGLASALAETGARVLLVDTDLRRPSLAGRLGLEGAAGLTTVLLGRAAVPDVVQEWGSTGLEVLTAGQVPPNPSELLGSPAMTRLLAELREAYDHVVLDTAPVLPVADALILSRAVDGMLLVANATRVRRAEFGQSVAALRRVDARVLGVVLNQARREEHISEYRPRDESAGLPRGAGGDSGAPRRWIHRTRARVTALAVRVPVAAPARTGGVSRTEERG
jgi:capsular exopolysaccharide synthesis family protein